MSKIQYYKTSYNIQKYTGGIQSLNLYSLKSFVPEQVYVELLYFTRLLKLIRKICRFCGIPTPDLSYDSTSTDKIQTYIRFLRKLHRYIRNLTPDKKHESSPFPVMKESDHCTLIESPALHFVLKDFSSTPLEELQPVILDPGPLFPLMDSEVYTYGYDGMEKVNEDNGIVCMNCFELGHYENECYKIYSDEEMFYDYDYD